MKRSLTLELLEHLIVCGASFAVSSLFVPYGQSLRRSLREVERQAESCPHDFSSHSRGTVSVTLSNLKRKNLVINQGPKKKAVWFITKKGKRHFENMGRKDTLPREDGKVRLVIYDIPENRNTQRGWLRNKLSTCDYIFLQKSVWLGTRPLPKKLHNELRERGILPYIHIVSLDGLIGDLKKR